MHVFVCILLTVSSALAYQVTSPGNSQGWNTTGPNVLTWNRVDTDPLNFTVFLTNVGSTSNQLLNSFVDGTLGSTVCNVPSGGWPTGSGFRVNIAQDAQHPDTLLAQSNEFNITSGGSTTSSGSAQTVTSATTTSSASGVSSSNTSTSPTGTSASLPSADVQAGLLAAVAVLTALITTLF